MEVPAETERPSNIVCRPEQENQQTNPIEKDRQPTDVDFMVLVFLPIVVFWLAIAILGFSLAKVDQDETLDFMQSFINGPVTKFSTMLPISVFICMSVICLCLFLFEKLKERCIYASIIISIVVVIGYIFSTYSYFTILFAPYPSTSRDSMEGSIIKHIRLILQQQIIAKILIIVYYIIWILVQLIFVVCGAMCFFKADIRVLCDITTKSCRLIQRSPSLLCFASLISILIFLVFSITLNTFLLEIYAAKIFNYLSIITIFGGICVTGLVINFARMIISEYAINYFYMKNEKAPIGNIIIKILRNHMGTAMFGSTMFVPFICSTIQAFKHKPSWKNIENNVYYDLTKVSLVISPDIALIFSTIYGTGFIKSYQNLFDAVLRRPTTYLAMLLVIDGVFATILLGLIIPVAGMIAFAITVANSPEDMTKTVSVVVYGCSYIFFIFALLISSTMKAQLVNKIIILNEEDRDTEEKTEMLKRF